MEQVFPELVITDTAGYKNLDYGKLTAVLAGAVQTLDARTSFIANAATSTVLTVDVAGNVGIGTTTPPTSSMSWATSRPPGFVNISTRDSKTGITYLTPEEASTTLAKLESLKVATYRYTIEDQSDPLRLGLIAEDAELVAPEILSLGGKGVDLYKLATFTLSGVQALNLRLEDLATSTPAVGNEPFVSAFFSNLFARLTQWFADAANGVGDFFANRVRTKELCVSDGAGETCVTRTQLDALLASAAGASGGGGAGAATSGDIGGSSTTSTTTSTTTPDTEAPVITLNGNNPATVNVGDIYTDLGASVTDNVNNNLGYTISLNGATSTDPSSLFLDTGISSTNTLTFFRHRPGGEYRHRHPHSTC